MLSVTPLSQVNELAPEPLSVVELPIQILEEVANEVTFGKAFTVTVTVLVSLQPFASVPVTV
jgi:hypothetical protein